MTATLACPQGCGWTTTARTQPIAAYALAKVKDTGKKGTITLTVTVEPMPKSDGSALIVTDEIKLKLPEFAREASLFFADDDNNLRRDDPRQLTFESLREVPAPPGVDPFTGEITTTVKGA